MGTFEKTYPSVLESVEVMHEALVEVLNAEQVPPEMSQSFLLATSEAFTNALIHGNKRDPQKQIYVSVLINEKILMADISDEGSGGLKMVSKRKRPEILAESGRGIDLIKHFVDSVAFEETADGGLKVSIRIDRQKTEENKADMNSQ